MSLDSLRIQVEQLVALLRSMDPVDALDVVEAALPKCFTAAELRTLATVGLPQRHDRLRQAVMGSATRLELAGRHVQHEAKLKAEDAREPLTRWAGYMIDEAEALRKAAEEIDPPTRKAAP